MGVISGYMLCYQNIFFSFSNESLNDDLIDMVVERPEYAKERIVKYYEITEDDLYEVFYRYVDETICKYTNIKDKQYVSDVAKAFKDQVHYVPNPEIVFYTLALSKQESKFNISAKPPKKYNSSASGIGQVIWRWHSDKLLKTYPWRNGIITREMLDTDIIASIDAMYIVFQNYLFNNKNYKEATIAYFGKNQSELAKNKYRMEALKEYHLVTQRLFRHVLSKEPKTKVVRVNKQGNVVYEYALNHNINF